MSTAADRIKANAARFRQTPSSASVHAAADDSPAQPPTPSSPPATAADAPQRPVAKTHAVRDKDVRRTVDLSPSQHRNLDIWQREAADTLGYARVTGQEVLSALVDLLLDDPHTADRVIGMLPGRR